MHKNVVQAKGSRCTKNGGVNPPSQCRAGNGYDTKEKGSIPCLLAPTPSVVSSCENRTT